MDKVIKQGYFVSSDGSITSTVRAEPRVLKPFLINSGYLTIRLGAGNKSELVHRIVAKSFCSGYEIGLTVNHKDGNKLNNNADNLEWCSQSTNSKKAFTSGLCRSGRRSLKDDEALMVLSQLDRGSSTRRQLADKFNVSTTVIDNMAIGKTYRDMYLQFKTLEM